MTFRSLTSALSLAMIVGLAAGATRRRRQIVGLEGQGERQVRGQGQG